MGKNPDRASAATAAAGASSAGPLAGVRVVEAGGIGPGPHCGMILADLGADVVRFMRPEAPPPEAAYDLLHRNKRAVALDLKQPGDVARARALIDRADMLVEGFRPGVMEKLGLGPAVFEASNPRLVYGRMTGWGQEGPFAQGAGHDLTYIAPTGALHAIGPKDGKPAIPLNLVGDFGGGALYLAVGLLAAFHAARASGRGQVVDCAIVDGVSHLMAMQMGMLQAGTWSVERGVNIIDGAAPFYDVYETSDGHHVTVAAIEPKFYATLLKLTGLEGEALPEQNDQSRWNELRARFAALFITRTRAEWCALLEGTDACFAPVLDFEEARAHPQIRLRNTIVNAFGLTQPAPAPRLSRTPGTLRSAPAVTGADFETVLSAWATNG